MIGLIVATHGSFAREVLRAAEMIYGKQLKVVAIPFVPGENQDTLIEKYTVALGRMDGVDGVLFLCDLFGGSPFNAASRLAATRSDTDVISGLNLPMLLEVCGVRGTSTLGEVVDRAVRAGQEGIQSLRNFK